MSSELHLLDESQDGSNIVFCYTTILKMLPESSVENYGNFIGNLLLR